MTACSCAQPNTCLSAAVLLTSCPHSLLNRLQDRAAALCLRPLPSRLSRPRSCNLQHAAAAGCRPRAAGRAAAPLSQVRLWLGLLAGSLEQLQGACIMSCEALVGKTGCACCAARCPCQFATASAALPPAPPPLQLLDGGRLQRAGGGSRRLCVREDGGFV